MSNSLLLLPDFLLIVCGFLLCRFTSLGRPVWDSAEKLVYYLLFPVLLFNSIVTTPLAPAQLTTLASVGGGVLLCGIALASALRAWPGVDAGAHASGAQVAYRFNSYIGLALADRLAGPEGVAWMALLIALCVPVANVAAVWPLARHGGQSYGRELLRNPLIVSTVAGLLANLAGLHFPEAADIVLRRIGAAALPLGLMAVGAGLTFGALKRAPVLAAALLSIRHIALPAVGIALSWVLMLQGAQREVAVLFATLPTASSCYVLAARMGGDAEYVAGLVTLSTVLGMVGIPVWLSVVRVVG